MSITMTATADDKIDELSRKLDRIEQKLDELTEYQKVIGEIQVETVNFFQVFREEHRSSVAKFDASMAESRAVSAGGLNEIYSIIESMAARMAVDLNALKQTSNLTLREKPAYGTGIRCVFLIHSIPMWDALADVYWSMTRDRRFDPIVISINSTALGRGQLAGEDKVSHSLNEQGIPHLRFDMPNSYDSLEILKALRPDVIFRQQQWDMCVPPAFHTQELTFARLCVVPYGMNIISSLGDNPSTEVTPLAFDQRYHRSAWKVFCETEMTREYYRSFKHSDPEKFIVSGYPKLDRLLQAKGKGVWPIKEKGVRGYRVIWAPHYSLGKAGIGFGVFDRIYAQMIAWAEESDEIQFVLKPHPALFSDAIHPDAASSFKKTWLSLPNCAIEEAQYGELFEASDLMVTDGVSFLTEYHLFQKPLVFLDSGHHAPFNSLGKRAEACAHRVGSFDEMKTAVLEYKSGKEWGYHSERDELLRILRPNTAPAASYILESIAQGIQLESQG